ncbi:MAG: EAL domain-containing protein [Aminipila sp.]
MDKLKPKKNINFKKYIDLKSITVKLLALLCLLVIIQVIIFVGILDFSNILADVDTMAAQTETLPPFDVSDTIRQRLFVGLAISCFIGFGMSLYITTTISRPIKKILSVLSNTDPMQPLVFEHTNISELDNISKTIEILSSTSTTSASKMSNVLDVAGKSMGIFEYFEKTNQVYVTKHLFSILEENDPELLKTGLIPANVFNAKMSKLEKYYIPSYSTDNIQFFHIEHDLSPSRWIRLTTVGEANRTIGLIEDVTEDMLRKNKMKFERDYDVLTSLLNRRAFNNNLQKLFSKSDEIKVGAMVSIDLDNLKVINDTYGHECGDEYIRAMANVLNASSKTNTIISRIGGDEFCLFMFGYNNKEEIRAEIIRLNISINNYPFKLPNGSLTNLSASMGASWYPSDSLSASQLIKYADFAMYTIKKTTKSSFAEFVLQDYENSSKVSGKSDHLGEFIKKRMFEYTFQPIISAKTGDICAYEALLKSNHPAIKNPKQLFELAKSSLDLYEIERLTWIESLTAFDSLGALPSIKLFINSIPNQLLTNDDKKSLERNFCHLLSQVVIELNDAGRANLDLSKEKYDFVKQWGGQVALGDYGTGTYDNNAFQTISPKYLKVDISITQNLYRDNNRHKLVESIVAFAHQRGVYVIAEGIEKPEDMFTLIDIGVDYLQGYHLCKPMTNPPKKLAITTAQITNYNKRKLLQSEDKSSL